MILGFYKFTYENGLSQVLSLIDHSEFNAAKELEDRISELKELKKKKKKSFDKDALSLLQKEKKDKYGSNYFTNKSPMFESIKSGYIGNIKVIVRKVDSCINSDIDYDEL